MIFDTCEDGREHHGDEGEDCGCSTQLREGVERSRERAHPTEDGPDDAEGDGAGATVRHGVQILGTYQHVETLFCKLTSNIYIRGLEVDIP